MLSISLRTFQSLVRAGKLRRKRLGRRCCIISRAELEKFLTAPDIERIQSSPRAEQA